MLFVPPAGKEFREARHRLYWRTEHPGTRVSQGSRGIEPAIPSSTAMRDLIAKGLRFHRETPPQDVFNPAQNSVA